MVFSALSCNVACVYILLEELLKHDICYLLVHILSNSTTTIVVEVVYSSALKETNQALVIIIKTHQASFPAPKRAGVAKVSLKHAKLWERTNVQTGPATTVLLAAANIYSCIYT